MSDSSIEVLVLGEDPSAYLAAALLRQKAAGKLRVAHCPIPGDDPPERLVRINPAFFDLHKLLEPLKRKLELSAYHGLTFVADDREIQSEYRSKPVAAWVGSRRQVRDALCAIAEADGVNLLSARSLEIEPPDETGVTVRLGGSESIRATVLIVAGRLPAAQQKLLGMPEEWERGVVHRYAFVRHEQRDGAAGAFDLSNRPTLPMSLDLNGQLVWAWLLAHGDVVQLTVSRPIESADEAGSLEMLRRWATVLHEHGILTRALDVSADAIRTMDVPLAGALAHEGVANRALLIGPAGGFYSACGEDIYPNCWSAIYAADAVKRALKEPHLQDALHPYRHKWRTTLGEYLRGPQHNLRFLLPLVYKNPAMTARLAESILRGKSVVR